MQGTERLPEGFEIRQMGAHGLLLEENGLLKFVCPTMPSRLNRARITLTHAAQELALIHSLRRQELAACRDKDYGKSADLAAQRCAAYERYDRATSLALGKCGAGKRGRR